jgi:hypothetical protein
MTKMEPTDDGGLIQRYTEISWRYSTTPRRRDSRRIGQLTMQSIWNASTICHIGGLQLSGVESNGVFSCVESSGIHAIAWIKITCSRGRILHLDLH